MWGGVWGVGSMGCGGVGVGGSLASTNFYFLI